MLLEHAARELRAELHPDPCEMGLAVSAAGEVLEVLCRASRGLEIDPPDLIDLRPWALSLIERASGPAPRRRCRGW